METKRALPDAYDANCPSRQVLDRIADKWTTLVILLLKDEAKRFSELRHEIRGISPKMLTQTLRTLERDGLVSRTIYAEIPPRVEYRLTSLGATLCAPIAGILDWAEAHMDEVAESQGRYDSRETVVETA